MTFYYCKIIMICKHKTIVLFHCKTIGRNYQTVSSPGSRIEKGPKPLFDLTALTFTAIQTGQAPVHDDGGLGVAFAA